MGRIKRFEDLDCWKLSLKLCIQIYDVSDRRPMKDDWDFVRQISRASVSTLNNISEGFYRFSRKEFKRFLEISASSSAEVRGMIHPAYRLDYIEYQKYKELLKLTDHTIGKIINFIKKLNG